MTRAPIFLVGDLRDGGQAYVHDVLDALARTPVGPFLRNFRIGGILRLLWLSGWGDVSASNGRRAPNLSSLPN
jgi:hypothetical protein